MEIFNRDTSKNTGRLPILTSWMLIGPQNSSAKALSVQISEIPIGSEQPIHQHEPEQCYYIIRGEGLMIVEGESKEVASGDAVYVPAGASHGIENIGDEVLEYLTSNTPAFSKEYEDALWPCGPTNS